MKRDTPEITELKHELLTILEKHGVERIGSRKITTIRTLTTSCALKAMLKICDEHGIKVDAKRYSREGIFHKAKMELMDEIVNAIKKNKLTPEDVGFLLGKRTAVIIKLINRDHGKFSTFVLNQYKEKLISKGCIF